MTLPYRIFLFCLFAAVLTTGCKPSIPEEIVKISSKLPEKVDYNIHVKPILSDRCFACHGNDKNKQEAALRLDIAENAYGELKENIGRYAIVPGNLKESQVFHRIISDDPEVKMPPPEFNLTLSNYEKAVLIRWIEQGAEYKPHWAFIKPKKINPPTIEKNNWAHNSIDQFVLKSLKEKDWQTSKEADKEILLRRVTLDLIGLPPTIEEMNAFAADDSPQAYQKVVNRLLDSPHYGERMATDWMDLARFADTHGYTVDRYRDMSPWRDWVIKAFNENMPYDQFILWQLAGDMLPNATKEQILATGFNRNHQQNMEGGIVGEEFRVEYVADRTNTLGTAFLGLTLECARCHDHKYDPISQKEYYQLFSFFNNIKEAGQISWNNATPVPTMFLTNEKQDSIIDFVNKEVIEKEEDLMRLEHKIQGDFENWLKKGRLTQKIRGTYQKGITAHFDIEDSHFINRINRSQHGKMKQGHADRVSANLEKGKKGNGLILDGDAWLDLGQVGVFDRMMPFSIGLWVNLPRDLKSGVIFHKGDGAALYNFRGFHLAIKDNKLEILMAHNTPYNALLKYGENLPRNEWIQLTMTYDGSSTAKGLKVYRNGEILPTYTEQDNLYKNILFNKKTEPGLQIGARYRGIGLKGAIIDEIMVFNRELSEPEILQLFNKKEAQSLFEKPVDQLLIQEKNDLKNWYLNHHQAIFLKLKKALQQSRTIQNKTLDSIPEIMVMQEMLSPRPSYILERGQYDAYGEEISPATPINILPMPGNLPKNRLGLAKWLMHEDNPLTARVTVNRLWQQFFGKGLVKTTDDFGFQGKLPTHKDLLDWLAVDFQESGWDIKAMVKQIVLSATYRQSSIPQPEMAAMDKTNTWLSRGPSARLTAEMVRDNALAASGLLTKKIGGKSVKPYQPEGLWKVNGGKYLNDTGDNLYRRSLYTFWKRSVPNPTQATFDAPTRSNCTVKRQKTSTPLQALILLNDPTFAEAAKVLGESISKKENLSEGINEAFRKLTGRQPLEGELEVLLELQKSEYEKFKSYPEKTKGWLKIGNFNITKEIEPAKLAANTIVASTIINADATIVKR